MHHVTNTTIFLVAQHLGHCHVRDMDATCLTHVLHGRSVKCCQRVRYEREKSRHDAAIVIEGAILGNKVHTGLVVKLAQQCIVQHVHVLVGGVGYRTDGDD